MKRIICILLTTLFLLPNTYVAHAKESSSWAQAYIEQAEALNLVPRNVNDYTDLISRKQYAEILVKLVEKLSGNELNIDSVSFTDTNDLYVLKAYSYGIVNGNGTGQFNPDDNTTREQVAVMFINTIERMQEAFDYFLMDQRLLVETSETNTVTFEDQEQIASWSLTSIEKAYANGIISGVGHNMVSPKGETTVEQALTMAVRVYEKYNNQLIEASKAYELYEKGYENGKYRMELLFQDYNKAISHFTDEEYFLDTRNTTNSYYFNYLLNKNIVYVSDGRNNSQYCYLIVLRNNDVSFLSLSINSSISDFFEKFGEPARIGVEYPSAPTYSEKFAYVWEHTIFEGKWNEAQDVIFSIIFTDNTYTTIKEIKVTETFYCNYMGIKKSQE